MQTSGSYLNRSVPTSKEALTVYLPAEIKEALKQWAEADQRSMAWIVEQLVTDAIKKRQYPATDSES